MKKTMLRWIALPAFLLLASPHFAASGDMLNVNSKMFKVRTGPGEDFKVITQLKINTAVEEITRLNDWVAVQLPGMDKNGWIHSSMLAPSANAAPATGSKVTVKPVMEEKMSAPAMAAKKPAATSFDAVDFDGSLKEGISQYKQENYEEAAIVLEKARQQSPDSSTAAFFLGLTYKQIMDYPKAATHLRDAVTLVPHIKEALVELIEVLYRTKTDEGLVEAKEWVAVAEKENIMPDKVTFLKGLIAQREGKADEAVAQFEKAKELNPDYNQSAEFQIALTLINDRELKKAQERLKAAILQDPQSDLASFARQYQDMVEKRIELEKPLRLTFGLFENYNTNLNAAPTDSFRYNNGTNEEESLATIASFRASYVPILKGPWLFSANYAFSASLNDNLSTTYDSVSNSISAIPGYNFGRYSVNLAASYDHSRKKYGQENGVDLDPIFRDYLGTFKIGPLVRVIASQNHMLEFYAGYLNNEYFQPAASAPNAQGVQVDDRDSDGQSLYASWIWLFKENAFFNLKYEFINDNTIGGYWDNKTNNLSASIVYPLAQTVKLQLSGMYSNVNYSQPSPEIDFIAGTATDKNRDDEIYSGSLGVTWDFYKNTSFISQLSHTDAQSSHGQYDYKSDLYSIGLEYRY